MVPTAPMHQCSRREKDESKKIGRAKKNKKNKGKCLLELLNMFVGDPANKARMSAMRENRDGKRGGGVF